MADDDTYCYTKMINSDFMITHPRLYIQNSCSVSLLHRKSEMVNNGGLQKTFLIGLLFPQSGFIQADIQQNLSLSAYPEGRSSQDLARK